MAPYEHPSSSESLHTRVNGVEILRLTEDNFSDWNVDIRALLRSKKLWKYTQEACPEGTRNAEKWEETADLMTPTLSTSVKSKLTEEEFNDGYKMYQRLIVLQPNRTAQFMRYTREYYSLKYAGDEPIDAFHTRVKVLEERIDKTKVILDSDKRTLLCLQMALPMDRFKAMIQLWEVTEGMTADKAKEMLREHERRHNDEDLEGLGLHGYRAKRQRVSTPTCTHCHQQGHLKANCWNLHPELRQAPRESGGSVLDSALEFGRVSCFFPGGSRRRRWSVCC